jgi:hypothetical protein
VVGDRQREEDDQISGHAMHPAQKGSLPLLLSEVHEGRSRSARTARARLLAPSVGFAIRSVPSESGASALLTSRDPIGSIGPRNACASWCPGGGGIRLHTHITNMVKLMIRPPNESREIELRSSCQKAKPAWCKKLKASVDCRRMRLKPARSGARSARIWAGQRLASSRPLRLPQICSTGFKSGA